MSPTVKTWLRYTVSAQLTNGWNLQLSNSNQFRNRAAPQPGRWKRTRKKEQKAESNDRGTGWTGGGIGKEDKEGKMRGLEFTAPLLRSEPSRRIRAWVGDFPYRPSGEILRY